ncbi:MAG: hypothetical protein K2I28_06730 [Muribaculaceae bacterium]|nr:hypothetical protein [Muribaculaceae bacterium]
MTLLRYTALVATMFWAMLPAHAREIIEQTDSIEIISAPLDPTQIFVATDTTLEVCADTLTVDGERMRVFNPDPTRATWLSVLCPGLGQIYNRRYWKLPIVIGAYMGLAYATSWNNTMLTDYTKAYNDLMDNDPDTRSYMNFFAPGVSESSLNRNWLQNTFQSRKNYFRRNRDLCIVGMIGVYLVAIVDAYVDASLAHFDISPNLSLQWAPTLIQETRSPLPSFGVQWALCF